MFKFTKKELSELLLFLSGLFGFGAFMFWYDSSSFAIRDYQAICPQNYGDAVSLNRCYISYHMQYSLGQVGFIVSSALLILSIVCFVVLKFKKN